MISIATYICYRLMTKFRINSFENYPAVLNWICVHDYACAFVRPFLNINYQVMAKFTFEEPVSIDFAPFESNRKARI